MVCNYFLRSFISSLLSDPNFHWYFWGLILFMALYARNGRQFPKGVDMRLHLKWTLMGIELVMPIMFFDSLLISSFPLPTRENFVTVISSVKLLSAHLNKRNLFDPAILGLCQGLSLQTWCCPKLNLLLYTWFYLNSNTELLGTAPSTRTDTRRDVRAK